MSDQPITKAELAEVLRYRVGKPPTRVPNQDGFRNPAHCVKFPREIIERERKRMWKGP